jgi:hypothetical protein
VLIFAIVAQPLLSDVWSPAIAAAQLSR